MTRKQCINSLEKDSNATKIHSLEIREMNDALLNVLIFGTDDIDENITSS